jgi:hypothetical protein
MIGRGRRKKPRPRPHPMSDFKDESGAITVSVTGNRTRVSIDHEKAGVLAGGTYRLIKNAVGDPVEIVVTAPNPEELVADSGFTKEDFPTKLEWCLSLELEKDA